MASPSSRKPLSFLDLPLELRLQIYRHLTHERNPFHRHLRSNLPQVAFSFHPAILRTNRLISNEAHAVFWGENWWNIDICYSFNYFRRFYLNPDNMRQFSLMRRFRLQFVLDRTILSEYPSYGLEKYMRDTFEYAVKVLEVLPRVSGLQVEVCWCDTLRAGSWEEKRCVLEALKVLPSECVYTVGHIFSANSLPRAQFRKCLDHVMNSRCYQEDDFQGNHIGS